MNGPDVDYITLQFQLGMISAKEYKTSIGSFFFYNIISFLLMVQHI